MARLDSSPKKFRGQFFTTSSRIQSVMLGLLSLNSGRVLEPSAGAGHLVSALETHHPHLQVTGIELDSSLEQVCSSPLTYQDFFVYSEDILNNKQPLFDAVLGNPPYIPWKSVEDSSRLSSASVKSSYSDKTNLYHLFMDRCIDLLVEGGEMVLIVPKEWLYQSSAAPLREKLSLQGHITHFIDCGGEKLFQDASVPALMVFRFVKTRSPKNLLIQCANSLADAEEGQYEKKRLIEKNGRWLLLSDSTAETINDWGRLGDLFSVKVGLVSGADDVYRLPAGVRVEDQCIVPYVTSKGVQQFINVNSIDSWDKVPPLAAKYLMENKDTLLSRRVSKFTEANWWKYGALRNLGYMESGMRRIYVIARTRSNTPFFIVPEECKAQYFSSAIMGLFLLEDSLHIEDCMKVLNSPLFRELLKSMFLTSGSRIYLQPSTLEDVPFPKDGKLPTG